MQLLVLALVLAIFVHDAQLRPAASSPTLAALSWSVGGRVAVALLYGALCAAVLRRLGRPSGAAWLRWLNRAGWLYRLAAMALYGWDLRAGMLDRLRAFTPRIVLLPEVAVMLPTLALLGWAWWAYYPIDRRLREASLMPRLDAGLPMYPIWTRGQYVLSQFRHQVALVLVPLWMLLGWEQAIARWFGPHAAAHQVLASALFLGGVGCVFLFAPVMIRRIWDTAPLPAGELRVRLLALCRQHGVGVRELLLWRTYGGMINAAVMGLLAPVRYILLTDALVESLPARQVEAVMAHEVAHVRRRHMFWLLLAAAGAWASLACGWAVAAAAVAQHLPATATRWMASLAKLDQNSALPLADVAMFVPLTLSWIAVFGWVSRRFERQADSFAVQHLARQAGASPSAIDAASVAVMSDALQQVADLNNIAVDRRSWRHGRIAWRQDYLRSLVGRPIEPLPIDAQLFWINCASLAVFIGSLLAIWLLPERLVSFP